MEEMVWKCVNNNKWISSFTVRVELGENDIFRFMSDLLKPLFVHLFVHLFLFETTYKMQEILILVSLAICSNNVHKGKVLTLKVDIAARLAPHNPFPN